MYRYITSVDLKVGRLYIWKINTKDVINCKSKVRTQRWYVTFTDSTAFRIKSQFETAGSDKTFKARHEVSSSTELLLFTTRKPIRLLKRSMA